MSEEDKKRLSFLLIVTVIVFALSTHALKRVNERGLSELDAAFNGYLSATARSWAQSGDTQN